MSEEFKDTYFLNSKIALEVAKQKNRVEITSSVDGLQLCYYDGEKLKNSPKNCIHVPLKNVTKYFTKSNNRIPTFIKYTNSDYSNKEQKVIQEILTKMINQSIDEQSKLNEKYMRKIQLLNPDFRDKKLRVFIPTSRNTTVMQHVSKQIAECFEKHGYEVYFHIQKNDMQSGTLLSHLKALYKFNPHITFNVNHMNNSFLSENVFNFVWFQDAMETITDDTYIKRRNRDYVFSLIKDLQDFLYAKQIPSKIQPFCINTTIYKKRKSISREKKIVFIGSSYHVRFFETPTSHNIAKDLITIFNKKIVVTKQEMDFLAKKHKTTIIEVNHIYGAVLRDNFITNLCKMNIKYDIEVYGWGWDKYDVVKPYYKGVLKFGEDISKVYNSATYTLITGGYILQQRLLEATASGCIPIIHDSRYLNQDLLFEYKDNVIFFKTNEELEEILNKKVIKKDVTPIAKEFSYKKFVKKMITIIENK